MSMVRFFRRIALLVAVRLNLLTAALGAVAFSLLSFGLAGATAPTLGPWPSVSDSSLTGGESDLTGLVTNHLPYVIGIFVAMLALGWITSKISKTARGKRV